MIAMVHMDTIQIEVTNRCVNSCANCSRFVDFVRTPFFMDFDVFKRAVNSMAGYPNMIGLQGGEPLLHPEFERMCDYALSKIPREKLGLWTCLPRGLEKYREIICRTFGNIFINDHSRNDIFHHPFLVAAQDVIQNRKAMFASVDKCHFQKSWSASVNPRGAYFCEMAASFAMLYPSLMKGWRVEEGWWWRTPKDYKEQIEEFCQYCGGSLFLKRRSSLDLVSDVSDSNLEMFKRNGIKLHDHEKHDQIQIREEEQEVLAAYKDQAYRDFIASKYGIFLLVNEKNFNEPYLMKDLNSTDSVLSRYKERYA